MFKVYVSGYFYHTGMAGKDDISNAVLGGASDYMNDIAAKLIQWYQAKDEDKVLFCLHTCNIELVHFCMVTILGY